MIAALTVLAATLSPTPALAAPRVGPPTDDPAIRISLNSNGHYRRGDKAKVEVRTREDGYLLLLRVDADRRLRVLFPRDPRDDNFVRGGQDYEIKGRGNRETFQVDDVSGQGVIYAAISRDPYRFDEYELSDHWDFRALNNVPVGDEYEADLNDFVRKLALSDFDYDLQRYDVSDRAYASRTTYVTEVYGSSWGSSYWGSGYAGSCYWSWDCGYDGTSLFIGLGFGRPFFYDPFYYDPFFFGPRYYAPVYYYPYYYPYSRYYVYPRYYAPVYYPRYYAGYGVPYRPRYSSGSVYARDFYHGGYYTSPWRRRDLHGGTSSYAAGRGTFGSTYVPGRLASGLVSDGTWRNRGVTAVPVSSTGSSYAPRRASDARPTDMSPARGEGRRATPNVVAAPSDRRPQARPADGRPEPGRRGPVGEPRRVADGPSVTSRDADALPRQVGPGAEPRRLNDGPTTPEPRARRETDDVAMPRAVGPSSSGRREVEPRGPETRAPEPRRAEPRDVRAPEPRPAVESGRREAPPPRVERPAPRAEPRVERPAPRAEPRGGNGGGGARRPSPRR